MDEDVQVQRARLSAVQARSTSFRGFSEEELDNLLPFLSLIEFDDGDPIMRCGENATWAGVLLGGELEAVLPDGKVIGTVVPGTVVGEMALFRGGKRGCDMRATIAGSIAVLKFSDVEKISAESPVLAHKLLLAFGREAYLHMVFPQMSPFVRVSKIEGGLGMSEFAIFDPAKQRLSSRGWSQAELTPLFAALEVNSVAQGMTVLVKGRTIEFVVFVLRGGIAHGTKRHPVGDIVGASYAIGGIPVLDEAVTEAESILGMLSLKRLEQLGSEQPRLASKLLRLLGVLALGGDIDSFEASGASDKGGGHAARKRLTASLSAPNDKPGGEGGGGGGEGEGGGGGGGGGAKAKDNLKNMEIVFQRQLADQAAKRAMLQDTMVRMQHEKKRENLVMSKLQREKEALSVQSVGLSEEIKRAQKSIEKLEAQLAKRSSDAKHQELRIKILETALEAGGVAVPQTIPMDRKGSNKMMAMMQKAMLSKAKEGGGAAGKPSLEKALAAKAKATESGRDESGPASPSKSPEASRPPKLERSNTSAALPAGSHSPGGGGAAAGGGGGSPAGPAGQGSPGGGGGGSPSSHAAASPSHGAAKPPPLQLPPAATAEAGGAAGGAAGASPTSGSPTGGAAASSTAPAVTDEGVARVFAAYDGDGSIFHGLPPTFHGLPLTFH